MENNEFNNEVQPFNGVPNMNNNEQPAQGLAIGSLVCGILAILCWFTAQFSFLSVLFGIAGIILAAVAKNKGNNSGLRTAGLVISIVAVSVGAIIFISCVACIGGLAYLFR